MYGSRARSRILRHTSSPSIRGIIRSSTARLGLSGSSRRRSASAPSAAIATLYPHLLRNACSRCRDTGSSSAIRILTTFFPALSFHCSGHDSRRAVLDGFEQCLLVDRLGQIPVHAGIETALSIPLHRVRRHGHDPHVAVASLTLQLADGGRRIDPAHSPPL